MEAMIQQLGMYEEDLDDVVFEEEGSLPTEVTWWIAQEVETKSLEDNLHNFRVYEIGRGL
jgi:hypothetical protein